MRNFPAFFLLHSQVAVGVATGLDYSETEQKTAIKWITGDDIYQKTIDFGALPNNTTKQVAHNITTIKEVIFVEGYAENLQATPTFNRWIKLAFVNTATIFVTTTVGLTDIAIKAVGNLSPFEECFVTLLYTKV